MNKQKNKGITLIALVITILVLLILAGVTISMLFGENGIINQANIASEETIKAKEMEQIKLAYNAARINELKDSDDPITSTDMDIEIKKYNENATAETDLDDLNLINVTFNDTKNKYTIDQNGNIEGKEVEEEKVEYIVGYGDEWLFDTSDNCVYKYKGDYSNLENNTLVIPTYWKESPSSTQEYEVKGIKRSGDSILSGNTAVAPNGLKLKIPFGIEKICGYTFTGCSQFTGDLIIPNSVTNIDTFAFNNCTGFNGSLIIGDRVEEIGTMAFKGCTEFTGDLVIGKGIKSSLNLPFYQGGGKFTGKLIIKAEALNWGRDGVKESAFSSLILENTVKEIPDNMLNGFANLQGTLKLPDSITKIGTRAFAGCSSLTGDLTIPNSVTTIGDYAFDRCSGFNGSLIIGDGVEEIGTMAFKGCTEFTGDLVIGKGIKSSLNFPFYQGGGKFTGKLILKADAFDWDKDGIKESAFSELVIDSSVRTISKDAFKGFKNLQGKLTIPNTVETIGTNAFYNCNSITAIEVDKAPDGISGSPWGWTKGTVTWLRTQ